MTNEEYVFQQTNKERAILKRSAAHKVNGCKSRKCKLGVDYMSKKEIEKQHGPVESWNLNKFYSYQEFKFMPDDIQIEYINHLIEKYHVGLQAISLHVFGLSATALSTYLSRKEALDKVTVRGNRVRSSHKSIEQLKQDIANKDDILETIDAAASVEDINDKTPVSNSYYEEIAASLNPYVVPIPKPKVESKTYSTTYISEKIDIEGLYLIQSMFKDSKIRVSITIESI